MCMWAIGKKIDDLGTITVAIDDSLGTLITYSNGDRSVKADKRKKMQESKDY